VTDPRPAVIGRRLAGVGRVLAIAGGKGGIGKSSVSVGLALALARDGVRVGLLDLDLSGPSDHVILGIPRPTYTEEAGLIPMLADGIRFMSIAGIVGDRPTPLRGEDLTNTLLELFAVTLWGELDVLLIDMPPGFTDTLLDVARYLDRAEHVIVATPSALVLETTGKALELLERMALPVAGVVENMRRPLDPGLAGRVDLRGAPVLGSIGFDPGYEGALGDQARLADTVFLRDVAVVARRLHPSGA
jgi:ATP-binding protein involved in chromosome partitioning